MKIITVKMNTYLRMIIDTLAIRQKVSRAQIIRNAIELMLNMKILPPPVEMRRYNVLVTVKVPEEMLTKLDEFADRYGLDRSEAVRRAIMMYLNTQSNGNRIEKARVEIIRF